MSQLTGLGLVLRGDQYIVMTANVDGRWGRDVDVARIVRGRDADPDSAHEVVLGETVARSLHVDVGDVLRFDSWSPEQLAAWAQREPTEEEQATFLGPTVEVEVVGISRHPADLTSDDPLSFFTALRRASCAPTEARSASGSRCSPSTSGTRPAPRGWPKSGPRP